MLGDFFEPVFQLAFGLLVGGGALGFVVYRSSWRWRRLADAYAASDADKPLNRHWTNMILDGAGPAWNNYNGVALIGATGRGITLEIMPPFSLFHAPLFIAYDEVDFEPASWLFQTCFMLEPVRAGGVRIRINEKARRWIEQHRRTD